MPAQNVWGVRFLYLNHIAMGDVYLGLGGQRGEGETEMYTCC